MFSHVGWHVGSSVKPGLNGQVSFSQKRFHIPNRVTLILIISEKSAFNYEMSTIGILPDTSASVYKERTTCTTD